MISVMFANLSMKERSEYRTIRRTMNIESITHRRMTARGSLKTVGSRCLRYDSGRSVHAKQVVHGQVNIQGFSHEVVL